VLQFHAAWAGSPQPSLPAMRLLTYSFVILIVPLFSVTRGQPGMRRTLWAAALATFAVSALHLSQFQEGEASWPVELLGHHASIPLAFAILYQDYPFALADLFLKRALALMMLVATAFVAIAVFGTGSTAFERFVRLDPRQVGALVTLWVATALVYPSLRRATAWFVDSIVLNRPDYRSLRASTARCAQAHESTAPLLLAICDLLAPALSARSVDWQESSPTIDERAGNALVLTGERAAAIGAPLHLHGSQDDQPTQTPAAAVVMIPTSEEPRYLLVVSELTRGRRLLSDDVATLEAIAIVIARRVDAIRMTFERNQRALREHQMESLATEAELRALRAQVNPHFLFNALTTIGYLIQTAPDRALDTLMRLTALLRGVLRSDGSHTTLGHEMEIIEAYLEIERARFEERLLVRIDVPAGIRNVRIPPLLLQPVVENAVKHGVSPLLEGGEVWISARVRRTSGHPPELALTVHDSGTGTTSSELERRRHLGLGLRNVEGRLACQYGSAASLTVHTSPGEGTTVTILLPAEFGAIDRLERVAR
jgi:two-component system, LytTR family, sensor kinase